jgi:hypothetical protein
MAILEVLGISLGANFILISILMYQLGSNKGQPKTVLKPQVNQKTNGIGNFLFNLKNVGQHNPNYE